MSTAASPSTPEAGAVPGSMDPKVLMALRNLEWRARVVVEGFWSGLHRSPYHGFSVEFTEYREYTPGDDLRYLDWRLLGRSDRHFIKRFEDETNLRCHLLVDRSRSMEYGTTGYTKAAYAATLAAGLAYLLHGQGDATGLLTFDEGVREYLPARHRRTHLRRLLLALEAPAGGRDTDLIGPLRKAAEIIRRRGVVVLISDLLAPVDQLERSLQVLAAMGHEITLFQVLDPAELTLGLSQAGWLEDVETGRALYVDPEVARARYRERLEAHATQVRAVCDRLGILIHRLSTDQPLETALAAFLRDRSRLPRAVRRARGGGRGGLA